MFSPILVNDDLRSDAESAKCERLIESWCVCCGEDGGGGGGGAARALCGLSYLIHSSTVCFGSLM